MIDVETVEDIQDSRLCAWNALLAASANPLPFQRYEWIKAWWENFAAKDEKPFILLASKQNKLVGIAPLSCKKGGQGRCAVIRFIGSGHFDYFDFIIAAGEEKDAIAGFISHINGRFKEFELQLKNIFKDSPTFEILSGELVSGDRNGMAFREDVVPYIELPETKEQFYHKTDRLLRSDVKRRERRLEETGKAEFRQCKTPDEAREVLEDFFAMHIKKWEAARGYSAYKFASRRKLLRDLLQSWFNEKIANLYYLMHGKERKLAICFAFELNKRFIFYTHAYDPEFSKFSPAKILVSKMINFSIDSRYKEFDFGIGREPYKLEWPCKIRELYNIYIYADKNTPLSFFLKSRRRIISVYFLDILPILRKFRVAVYLWRRMNKNRGRYQRFE